jgi:hypothetical protein
MGQVSWGHDFRYDRANQAEKLSKIASERGKAVQAARLVMLAMRLRYAADQEFAAVYSAWCD